jgi:hypothetical protein
MDKVLRLDGRGVGLLDVPHDGDLVSHMVRETFWALTFGFMYMGGILFARILAGVAGNCWASMTDIPRVTETYGQIRDALKLMESIRTMPWTFHCSYVIFLPYHGAERDPAYGLMSTPGCHFGSKLGILV